jgi:glycosyltransferase involved in cell wall biosynthesis
MRVDCHVHSKHSKRPSTWVLKKIGCPESFTEPLEIYRIARERGMTHVTISDHNRIEGALEIAHLPNTFISEEITTYFPEDGCKLHVLVLDIDEHQHADIQQCRENVFYLADYLQAQGLVHVVAHPLYGVNDRLRIEHFEKMLLLFKNFEMNGARNDAANEGLAQILTALTPAMIDTLADYHGIDPAFPEPWKKNITGGSDDHSALNIARTYTEIPDAQTLAEGLAGIEAGRSRAVRRPSRPETMAHNLYGIAYQYYRNKFNLERFQGKDLLVKFLDRALRPPAPPESAGSGLMDKVYLFLNARRRRSRITTPSDDLFAQLRHTITCLLQDDARFQSAVPRDDGEDEPAPEADWFAFVNQVANQTLIQFANHAMNHLVGGNVFNIFHTIGSAGGLYGLLGPYFIAFSLFAKDRAFTRAVRAHFGVPSPRGEAEIDPVRIGHFTDTFYDTNGVALTIQQQVEVALRTGKAMQVITCNEDPAASPPGVKTFKPVGTYELPEYRSQKLFYPPLLEMLRYSYEQGFTRIHSATPGPIGLAALAIARILKVPFCGTYHTQLPQYAQFLTGDSAMEDLTWKFVVWYYDQMDIIYAPSESTRQELIDRGIRPSKVMLYPRGVDIRRFSPRARHGFYRKRFGVTADLKLLYVGRVSKEKNLDVLTEAYERIHERHPGVQLVIVGDGPYLAEMRARLDHRRCTFTGTLTGDDLVQAYASADLFVFPSTTDTFGNVILEAQACGLPVVVTDQGGPRENMRPGKTGLVVSGNDSQALAEAIEYLIDHPRERNAMGHEARRTMEARSFDAAFLQTWESYKTVPAGDESLRQVAGF